MTAKKNDFQLDYIEFHEFVDGLVMVLEAKDRYTAGHSERVAHLALHLSQFMGFSEKNSQIVHIAGHLHDIGKIGIPDGILLKTGQLSPEEYAVIQKHSEIGANIFVNIPHLSKMSDIIRYHHERYDGRGYPEGRQGDEIPIEAGIIAVADSFDAMTTNRTYRAKMEISQAYQEIIRNSEKQFHPVVVDALTKIYQEEPSFLENLFTENENLHPRKMFVSYNSVR